MNLTADPGPYRPGSDDFLLVSLAEAEARKQGLRLRYLKKRKAGEMYPAERAAALLQVLASRPALRRKYGPALRAICGGDAPVWRVA